jgi:CelD/BcsL family acetyltransferase involved in cellulose biosynthesis
MRSVTRNIGDFTVKVSEEYLLEQLEVEWTNIQRRQEVPFFLSWTWISCWIKSHQPKIIVVSASVNQETICIGLFSQSVDKRHGFISSRQLRLHQAGDQARDQIWMEYNDFMCLSEFRIEATNACLQVLDELDSWDEIIISMMPTERANQLSFEGTVISKDLFTPSYSVDLLNLRSENKQYLDSLSTNTRYQIRKSIRLYEETYGALTLETAKNTVDALAFFHQAGELHVQRWKDSGYHNAEFIHFHKNLIKDAFESGNIDLIKITAGNEIVAILYYHIINQSVYFYLQGLRYESNHKFKPGLVAHSMATQHYLDHDKTKYDYMGGFSQYKKQLSSASVDMCTVTIQRPRFQLMFEKLAQSVKRTLSHDSN